MDGDRSGRLRAFAVLTVVFVAGALAGAVIGRAALRREQKRPAALEPRRSGKGPDVDQIPTPLLGLGLTADQETRLHAIARQWRPRAARELDSVRAHAGQIENGMFADMLCVLTPAQRDQYLAWLQNAKMPADVVDTRFAVVRANKCPATP